VVVPVLVLNLLVVMAPSPLKTHAVEPIVSREKSLK